MAADYLNPGPSREVIDSAKGPLLLEFGTDWCGHCRAAASAVDDALKEFPSVEHIRVEDGPGRRLGRSFRVKLWPTFIFLKDGVELARFVRSESAAEIRTGLAQVAGSTK